MRGADLLVKTLAAAGVRKIFSLSGNQIMPVYDACIDAGIEIVHTRHEAAAVFMADAWAQLTGEVGVALVTAAPGAANAFAALYTARQSESPVLLLTGDSSRAQDGSGAFQELDQVSISAPLTKLSMRCTAAATIGDDVARGISTALSGRPGPVHLALPIDVLQHDAGEKSLPDAVDYARTSSAPAEDSIDSLLQMLKSAERPLVLCGASLNDTRFGDENAKLSNAIGAPVVAMESPRGLKDPSLGDLAKAVLRADFILSLGKPVDFTVGFGAQSGARWLLVDADLSEQQRARKNLGERLVSFPLADPRAVAMALASRARGWEPKAAWRAEVGELLAARNFSTEPSRTGPIVPASLCAAVQRHIEREPETVVICDGGEFGQWAQACTRGTHRVINGPSGAIGAGLCYAVAAKKAKPSATVFVFMGDGTIGFHLAEFETAARENAPFIAIIGNDQCWNAEHQIQLRDYGPKRLIGCQLSDARYDKVVEGLGGHGEYVRDLAELDAALSRAVASGKPACINVVIEGVPAPSGHSH